MGTDITAKSSQEHPMEGGVTPDNGSGAGSGLKTSEMGMEDPINFSLTGLCAGDQQVREQEQEDRLEGLERFAVKADQ